MQRHRKLHQEKEGSKTEGKGADSEDEAEEETQKRTAYRFTGTNRN